MTTKKKEPMDLAVLEKVKTKGESKKIEARRGKRTTKDQRVPILDIRAQARGPITKGPPAYVACAMCTRMFGRPTGTRKRHAARHLRDHRMGRIKAPTAPDEK